MTNEPDNKNQIPPFGGDIALLLNAYANGYFPMAASRDGKELRWWDPELRGIIPLDAFHIPKSLQRFLRKHPFTLTCDRAFADVIRACAERSEDTWINDDIIRLYCELHAHGFAHSVECWLPISSPACGGGQVGVTLLPPKATPLSLPPQAGGEYQLAGGLYGVSLGGAFFGESMFSRASNASKVALVELVQRLNEGGYTLLDTQFTNEHLQQFGVVEIPRGEYKKRLEKALLSPPNGGVWRE